METLHRHIGFQVDGVILMRNKGFGLLEVLISLLVISVGVMGIIGLQKHMRKKSAEAEEHMIAARLAQESFEKIRVFDESNFSTVVVSGVVSQAYNGTTFTVTKSSPTDITIVPSSGIATGKQLKKLTIDVSWNSLDSGDSRNITLTSDLSPVTTFKSDEFFDSINGGGSGTGVPLKLEQDPSNPLHTPPSYVENAPYYQGDQMQFGGDKYVCKVMSQCRNHNTWGPKPGNDTNFELTWAKCTGGVCPAT